MHPDPFDFQALSVWAAMERREDELKQMKRGIDRERYRKRGYYGPFVLPATKLFLDFCESLVDRYNLKPLVRKGMVTDVKILSKGEDDDARFRVLLKDGRSFLAKAVVCALGPGPAFKGMLATLPWWANDLMSELRNMGTSLQGREIISEGASRSSLTAQVKGQEEDRPAASEERGAKRRQGSSPAAARLPSSSEVIARHIEKFRKRAEKWKDTKLRTYDTDANLRKEYLNRETYETFLLATARKKFQRGRAKILDTAAAAADSLWRPSEALSSNNSKKRDPRSPVIASSSLWSPLTERVQHSYSLTNWLLRPENLTKLRNRRVLVIGGGQTAAHLAKLALCEEASSVTLCSRRSITLKPYDVDIHYVGDKRPKALQTFWRLDDPRERLAFNAALRGGGSVSADVFESLLEEGRRRGRGSLTLAEATEVVQAHWMESSGDICVRLESGDLEHFDFIWLATGGNLDIGLVPLFASLQQQHAIPIVDGLPALQRDLAWAKGIPLYVMGAFAQLELGADALNLAGARSGGVVVARALMDKGRR
eukprot:g1123.t1